MRLVARGPIDANQTGGTDQRSGDVFELKDAGKAKALIQSGQAEQVDKDGKVIESK